MFERTLKNKLLESFENFPVVCLTGPRQSGKSTLIKSCFPKLPYFNLEDLNTYEYATQDPVSFIRNLAEGAVIDEIQKAPKLFSMIQVVVDEMNRNSCFVLSGSQNFLLSEQISQSLAGRASIHHLLPFSLSELKSEGLDLSLEEALFKGGYPRIHANKAPVNDWVSSYIQTYVEKDVRQIKNISDLSLFQRFIKACAARIGSVIDFSGIGNDLGVSHNTIRSWMTILETSFVVYQVQPHFKNFNKRLVKSPKLYFYDTGLACSLIGVRSPEELKMHALRGPLFENLVFSEIQKYFNHRGRQAPFYFWQDRKAEVDCLIEFSFDHLVPIEIKSGRTLSADSFKSLNYWLSLAGVEFGNLVYAGDSDQNREKVRVWSWKNITKILDEADWSGCRKIMD